ncbi:hypothetical protein IB266_03190 [Pseudomonas sp. Pdm06]|nr:hypothetical protein [Pseudomonas sp. Pdm06]MBD9462047.1 hypothetical protein [Pseudomonas sp. Pdm06]
MGQLNIRIMTFPAMPVASAYARAKDLNNHASSAIPIQTRSAVAASPATVIESAEALPARPSATVSLGNPVADVESQTYSRLGQLPGRQKFAPAESSTAELGNETLNAGQDCR